MLYFYLMNAVNLYCFLLLIIQSARIATDVWHLSFRNSCCTKNDQVCCIAVRACMCSAYR